MDTGEMAQRVLAPLLGCGLATAMFASNVFAVRTQQRRGKGLGALNCAQYHFMVGNTLGWLVYAFLVGDQWVFWSNFPGLLIGVWLCLKTVELADDGLVGWLCFWGLFSFASMFYLPRADAASYCGYTVCAVLFCFYTAPLSMMGTIIKQRDSSSLYAPMSAICLACSALWMVYGLVVDDVFIWGPNVVGCVLSILQLLLCLCIPNKGGAKLQAPKYEDLEEGGVELAVTVELAEVAAIEIACNAQDAQDIADAIDAQEAAEAKKLEYDGVEKPLKKSSSTTGLLGNEAEAAADFAAHRPSHTMIDFSAARGGATGDCAVCLASLDESAMALHCGHRFCLACLHRCSDVDLQLCPTCRHPHELNPDVLRARLTAFRDGYANWRRGSHVGARGEVDDISAPAK
ncbi:hypothetical protein M885DRAFT_64950 [Pelagophyceae sp. CCMP2097]|nr:hypothetical protein M885DRAFT_64950 [Pelagophyceae sp. CCMP2097]